MILSDHADGLAVWLGQSSGSWRGVNKLRMMPGDEYRSSPATSVLSLAAGRHVVWITYTWVEAGEDQDGILLLGPGESNRGESDTEVVAAWADSWHQQPQWMRMRGEVGGGALSVIGSYAADAQWRITIEPRGGTGLRLTMDNIMTDESGELLDYRVVEASYERF